VADVGDAASLLKRSGMQIIGLHLHAAGKPSALMVKPFALTATEAKEQKNERSVSTVAVESN
jgi:hypothetical protein